MFFVRDPFIVLLFTLDIIVPLVPLFQAVVLVFLFSFREERNLHVSLRLQICWFHRQQKVVFWKPIRMNWHAWENR